MSYLPELPRAREASYARGPLARWLQEALVDKLSPSRQDQLLNTLDLRYAAWRARNKALRPTVSVPQAHAWLLRELETARWDVGLVGPAWQQVEGRLRQALRAWEGGDEG